MSGVESNSTPSEAVPPRPATSATPEQPTLAQAGTKDQAQGLPVAFGLVRGTTSAVEHGAGAPATTAGEVVGGGAEEFRRPVHALFEHGEGSTSAALPKRQVMDL